jgi:hypothetical protein
MARHPNLAAANDLVRRAFDEASAAQQSNDYQLGGHANRAKQLLAQAADEIRLAAQSSETKGH